MSGSPWASRMRPRTAGWTVVRVSSVAAAAPAYAVRCTHLHLAEPAQQQPEHRHDQRRDDEQPRQRGRRRRPVCVLTPAVAGSGCGPRRAEPAGRAGRRPGSPASGSPRRRGRRYRRRGSRRRPRRARRPTVAAARPSSAPSRPRDAARWASPAVAPAAAYRRAVRPRGEPPGGTRSTTHPAASPSRAPVRGSPDDRGRGDHEDDEVGPEAGRARRSAGSTVATARAATRTAPVRRSPSRLSRGITTAPSRRRAAGGRRGRGGQDDRDDVEPAGVDRRAHHRRGGELARRGVDGDHGADDDARDVGAPADTAEGRDPVAGRHGRAVDQAQGEVAGSADGVAGGRARDAAEHAGAHPDRDGRLGAVEEADVAGPRVRR